MLLNISDFSLFYVKLQPPEKCHPFFSSKPPLKLRLFHPLFFENVIGGSIPQQKGGMGPPLNWGPPRKNIFRSPLKLRHPKNFRFFQPRFLPDPTNDLDFFPTRMRRRFHNSIMVWNVYLSKTQKKRQTDASQN